MNVEAKPFCPNGYMPLNDWIHQEAGRRGFTVPRRPMPNDVYCPIFDDLANYLGNDDDEGARLAVCNVNGGIEPVPFKKWRQDHKKRLAEISTGYIKFHQAWSYHPVDAKVFVRADLRLPLEPGVADGMAVRAEQDQGAALSTPAAEHADGRKRPRAAYMRYVSRWFNETGAPGSTGKERKAAFEDWLAPLDQAAHKSSVKLPRATQLERELKRLESERQKRSG
jgi:hypothetical protein